MSRGAGSFLRLSELFGLIPAVQKKWALDFSAIRVFDRLLYISMRTKL